jgi:MmyB-like transcription regulator ligand binding domain
MAGPLLRRRDIGIQRRPSQARDGRDERHRAGAPRPSGRARRPHMPTRASRALYRSTAERRHDRRRHARSAEAARLGNCRALCGGGVSGGGAQAGAAERIRDLVGELSRESAEFAAMWRNSDVRTYGEGTKHLRHPRAGLIGLEYSAFAVDGRPDLGMVVYNPATPADAERIRSLLKPQNDQYDSCKKPRVSAPAPSLSWHVAPVDRAIAVPAAVTGAKCQRRKSPTWTSD